MASYRVPGSCLVMPFDNHGTHIAVLQKDDAWVPGSNTESALIRQTQPSHFGVSSH
jgi:hypothetical protein